MSPSAATATAPARAPAFLTATQAAYRLGISRSLFFRLAKDYSRSAGKLGIGPAAYFSPRAPRWNVDDLDRCAKRYTRQAPAMETAETV